MAQLQRLPECREQLGGASVSFRPTCKVPASCDVIADTWPPSTACDGDVTGLGAKVGRHVVSRRHRRKICTCSCPGHEASKTRHGSSPSTIEESRFRKPGSLQSHSHCSVQWTSFHFAARDKSVTKIPKYVSLSMLTL